MIERWRYAVKKEDAAKENAGQKAAAVQDMGEVIAEASDTVLRDVEVSAQAENSAGNPAEEISEAAAEDMPEGTTDVLPEDEEAVKAEEEAEKARQKELKKQETIRKVKTFLLENKDILILSGQLALVTLICVAGIKNDLTPDCCKKKKKRKKK